MKIRPNIVLLYARFNEMYIKSNRSFCELYLFSVCKYQQVEGNLFFFKNNN